ncbi:MAG: hypothetical protein DMF81_13305 [Acidobacteria bacterium]|nr:MAG: hypothetical protein DMF81_13305 [Acidobacteriota bacterium]
MSCDRSAELLSAYLDGALPPAEREALEAHLNQCADCRARLESLRAVKHALARLPSREAPPGAVRARVESLRFAHRTSRMRILAAVLAAVALGAAGLFLARRSQAPTLTLTEELVSDHLRSVPDAMPAEVTSDDPQQVIAFFAGRVPFSPVAPVFPASRLVGGRLCQIDGRLVQLLFYDAKGEKLSLFVSGGDLGEPGCREARGHHVCTRRIGGRSLALVGKVPAEELLHLADEADRSSPARNRDRG